MMWLITHLMKTVMNQGRESARGRGISGKGAGFFFVVFIVEAIFNHHTMTHCEQSHGYFSLSSQQHVMIIFLLMNNLKAE